MGKPDKREEPPPPDKELSAPISVKLFKIEDDGRMVPICQIDDQDGSFRQAAEAQTKALAGAAEFGNIDAARALWGEVARGEFNRVTLRWLQAVGQRLQVESAFPGGRARDTEIRNAVMLGGRSDKYALIRWQFAGWIDHGVPIDVVVARVRNFRVLSARGTKAAGIERERDHEVIKWMVRQAEKIEDAFLRHRVLDRKSVV